MQNESLVELFQVEELEERLENCWNGQETQDHGYWDPNRPGVWVSNEVKVPCGTPNNNDPYRYITGKAHEN
jgi:hypothetical protein